jgi:hypothetical protein
MRLQGGIKDAASRLLSRLTEVAAGLFMLVTGLLLLLVGVVATISGLLDSRDRSLLWWAVPAVFLTAHVVFWGGRLILGRPRKDGGLLSPNWLLVLGLLLFSFPIASVITGAYKAGPLPGWLVVLLAILSPICVYGLSTMVAHRRRSSGASDEQRQHGA